MSSTTARFTFPETLGGQHKIISPKSASVKKTQNTERCIYVVQEYNCPHHPSLNTPHIFHRTPCPQALLTQASQTDCENYPHHEDELVQVSRYVLDRGCMECKNSARRRRHEETVKHPEILRRMQELGLGQEDIDHFEKVTSSFPASRRVLELVRAREKNERSRREETRWVLLREEGKDDLQHQVEANQEFKLQSKTDSVEVIPPATLASVEGPIVEGNDSAGPKKEHKITQRQPMAKKVQIPRPGVILAEKKTLQPSIKSTKPENPTASITPKVIQRDEFTQPQPRDPAAKETTPQPSTHPTHPTKLKNPTPKILPPPQIPIIKRSNPPSSAAVADESLKQTQATSTDIQRAATPPNPTHSPEKLTDNIHLDLDAEWDTDEERERVFGEVALAPSFGCQTGDEWIVVGSWEQ
ncbi:hypothetical protein BHYA_0266g00010 [Botrytis hyacinthi]|uniref:Uncharacterized protein n=1 Tax=Botrytis hyacinthi TaxID=278943 RepID=A0A4Z1GAN4_9HELO|nr:hypothetical protein BHYA_0266g00010 [Botrytis hyacinthi]